jgi:hypothetical protein
MKHQHQCAVPGIFVPDDASMLAFQNCFDHSFQSALRKLLPYRLKCGLEKLGSVLIGWLLPPQSRGWDGGVFADIAPIPTPSPGEGASLQMCASTCSTRT